MATYIFRSKADGKLTRATAVSLNRARDDAERASPPHDKLYNSWLWPVWECWEGGECLWHCDEDGDLHTGPRANG